MLRMVLPCITDSITNTCAPHSADICNATMAFLARRGAVIMAWSSPSSAALLVLGATWSCDKFVKILMVPSRTPWDVYACARIAQS